MDGHKLSPKRDRVAGEPGDPRKGATEKPRVGSGDMGEQSFDSGNRPDSDQEPSDDTNLRPRHRRDS
jgi:hypothetical protein